jgi:hypothetical protein
MKKPADTLVQNVIEVLTAQVQKCPGFDKLSVKIRDRIDSELDTASRMIVREVIRIVASRDFNHTVARLGKFKVGDVIEGVVGLPRTDANAINWMHFMDRDVILTFVPPEIYQAATEEDTQALEPEQLDLEDAIAEAETNGAGEQAQSGEQVQRTAPEQLDPTKVDFDPVTGEIIPEPPRPPRKPRDPNAPEAPQNIIKRTSMPGGVANQMPKNMLNKMGNDEDWGNEAADEMDGDSQ